ncbi:MAG: hypothetical protein QOJ07_1648 [Thermoleophilaceae bacterium]|jgi:K+-transporting ATPase KdpF subunit|nr:hypothetical protein [Thermoleophilaceae bacterium]
MTAANVIGGVVALLICAYLIYAMLRGEKL